MPGNAYWATQPRSSRKRLIPRSRRCINCGVLLGGDNLWCPPVSYYSHIWCIDCGPKTAHGFLHLDLGPDWMGRMGRWKDPKPRPRNAKLNGE